MTFANSAASIYPELSVSHCLNILCHASKHLCNSKNSGHCMKPSGFRCHQLRSINCTRFRQGRFDPDRIFRHEYRGISNWKTLKSPVSLSLSKCKYFFLGVFTGKPCSKPLECTVAYIPIITSSHMT